MHGIAVNCDCDLSWFDRFVPCGISDAAVTSLSAETGRAIPVTAVADVAEQHLANVLGDGRFRRADGRDGLDGLAALAAQAAAAR